MGFGSVYIELHTASAFSFLDGASLPSALIERAAALGYPALALLDRDGVYGAPQFYRAARAAGLSVSANMYTYPAGATGLNAAMPPWVQEGGQEKWIARLKDPATRKRVLA